MQKIVVAEKTGFRSTTPKVVIFDNENKEFYNYNPKSGLFNLPKGVYFSENNISKLDSPLNYKLPKLPKKAKRTNLSLSDFEIKIRPNPNKASIYLQKGIIEIDSNFWGGLSNVQKEYVLNHELGHIYFEDEKNADLYATLKMLQIGYNPSQIANVVFTTFSVNKENLARCENVINNLI